MLKNFLKDNGENIIFTGNYLEAYIPDFYFEGKLAEDYGTTVRAFGVFSVRMFDDKGKAQGIETFNIPALIYIHPSEMEKKELDLLGDGTKVQYRVAKFFKNSVLMANNVQQDASNAELFINLLFRGNVPHTIPYDDIIHIWLKNLELNSVKLGVSSVILEIIISEIYRNKSKPEESFAKVVGNNPKASMLDYRAANTREICARNSTFAALAFEDMDSMITTSLNINKYNKLESNSPIEKIIKM